MLATIMLASLLSLKVTPQICAAPCTIRIDVKVQRHPDNRWAIIEVSGPLFRSSMIPLDGESAPITQRPFDLKDLPAGNYEIKLILYQHQKESERVTVNLEVKGNEGGLK